MLQPVIPIFGQNRLTIYGGRRGGGPGGAAFSRLAGCRPAGGQRIAQKGDQVVAQQLIERQRQSGGQSANQIDGIRVDGMQRVVRVGYQFFKGAVCTILLKLAKTGLDGGQDAVAQRLDLPPVLETADALAFVPCIDTVLVVVEDDVTTENDLRSAIDMLAVTDIIGTVLNKAAS